ncbi:MAG: 30S ribosome-binding factor RbfA [Clostridiales bacterium]|jgi:ribosome-binding factor A|nr:30S ribosome-binding factor RbfA [Clostridia bacterium]MDI9512103.1 30S ribosome-binding factor RbfA [Bacillota bacterium]NLH57973.1 30S ribosome-binding factor RbfA [Clostridiales bacterium]
MPRYRLDRISEEIRKEVSSIIRNNVKDPRISDMATIVKVVTSSDLSTAKLYVSVLGSDEERESSMLGLKKAAGYIRKELGKRLDIRHIPDLVFILDKSIDYSIEIAKKLEEISKAGEGKNDY